jgi:amino-acid N-acetyltransferase
MVVSEDEHGIIAGCCTLHIVDSDLAEIRSLAVLESHQLRGIGRSLVQACISEAKELGIRKLFTLTNRNSVAFFERLGFRLENKDDLPHKVWWDCRNCAKYPDYCDESALVLDIA